MSAPSFFKRLTFAIRREPWQLVPAIVGSMFVGYTVCWGMMAPLYGIVSASELRGWPKYLAFAAISLVVGLIWFIWKYVPKSRISFLLPSTNTRLTVLFGDFFSEEGHKVIAVSEFFDGELGAIVSVKSLHGQFIEKYLGSQPSAFYSLIDRSLTSVPSTSVERTEGRNMKYPIGTTAMGALSNDTYFFVALTVTNPITHKVTADVPELWIALRGLWNVVREYAGGYAVVVPLIGGGPSGVGLPDSVLLNLILTSILNETKKKRITSEVKIVLHPSVLGYIDLRTVRKRMELASIFLRRERGHH